MTALGTLAVSPGHMLFVGTDGNIEIPEPTKVVVVGVPVPWLGLGLGTAFLLLFGLLKAPNSLLAPDSPTAWPLLLAMNVLVILIYRRERWLEIAFAAKGEPKRAYFTLYSQLGWWPHPEEVERLGAEVQLALQTGGRTTPIPPPTPGFEQGEECVTLACEECGKENVFFARHLGTVQQCEHCKAYLDVEQPDAER